jgi:hypothetical protein
MGGMQTDAYLASRQLTRGYLVIAMFIFAVITFQFFMGETLGIVRVRDEEPRAFWTIIGLQAAVFVLLVVLLVLHTR